MGFCKSVILYLLIHWSVNQCINAQSEPLRFEHIGIEEGLSNENVTAIKQDSKGYLWIGTSDGLNKYDGYSFTKYRFNPFDSNSISQNLIYTIFEDREGTIWVSTFEGLCKFDRATENFTRYRPSPKARFSDPNIGAISEDSDGMIWTGSYSGGLCRFNKKTGKFLPEYIDLGDSKNLKVPDDPEAGAKDGINCIYKDRAGSLWVGNTTGLHNIKLTAAKAGQPSGYSITHYLFVPFRTDGLSGTGVASVFEDKAGIIWVATNHALYSLNKETSIFTRYQNDPKKNNSISGNPSFSWGGGGIKEDQHGNLWIATNKGLNKLNKDRTIFTAYFPRPNDLYSISSHLSNNVEIDRSGILWVGSWGSKLSKANLDVKGFGLRRNEPANKNSLSSNEVTSIVEDSSGIIWIGTYKGLNRWDKKTNQFTHFRYNPVNPKTLRHDAIHAILQDSDENLWVCNGPVLSLFNKQTGEFTHYKSRDASYTEDQQIILSITEDREGLLWLGMGGGIKNFDKKTRKFIKHYYHSKTDSTGISDYTALAIYADTKDNIWVGYGSIATDRLNKRTGYITHYKHDAHDAASISSNIVGGFAEDSKGNLWLATWAGGLCKFDYKTEKFTTFTDKHGLADNTIFSILADNNNHLWLGTQNGLSRFDPATEKFTNYNDNDGLQSNIFGAGERHRGAICKGRDGTIYIGGINGFNFFDPLTLKTNTQIAPIVITRFTLFDKLVKGANESKKIVLNYDENYFSFEFSSLSYYSPEKNQYAYKLEGVDKDWVYSGSRRYAGYTDVDPGTYTFKVKGTNNDGVWNEQGAYITVIVKPPWWRTWWAYTLYALVFAALIYAFIQYRINKIRMQHEIVAQKHKATELEMLALRSQMNPHFIFNSLNSINRFILQNNKTQASEYLTKFSKLVRMILQNSQASLITMESELEALKLYLDLEALRFEQHFDYKITVPDDMDIEILKVPPLIIQPYVENAIWHGLMHKEERGHLDVAVLQEGDYLLVKITDDGIGRKHAAELASKSAIRHKSMGLKITAGRIEMLNKLNGNKSPVTINDLVNADGSAAGTEVVIKIPLLYE